MREYTFGSSYEWFLTNNLFACDVIPHVPADFDNLEITYKKVEMQVMFHRVFSYPQSHYSWIWYYWWYSLMILIYTMIIIWMDFDQYCSPKNPKIEGSLLLFLMVILSISLRCFISLILVFWIHSLRYLWCLFFYKYYSSVTWKFCLLLLFVRIL